MSLLTAVSIILLEFLCSIPYYVMCQNFKIADISLSASALQRIWDWPLVPISGIGNTIHFYHGCLSTFMPLASIANSSTSTRFVNLSERAI